MARWTTFASASFDIADSSLIATWSCAEIPPASRFARPSESLALCDPRDRSARPPLRPASLQLGQIHRLAAWLADAAVERIVDDEGAQRGVLVPAEHVDEERMCLRLLATRPSPAEAT